MSNATLEKQRPEAHVQKQIKLVREQLADIMDYLDLLDARVQNKGKRPLSIAEARARIGLAQRSRKPSK